MYFLKKYASNLLEENYISFKCESQIEDNFLMVSSPVYSISILYIDGLMQEELRLSWTNPYVNGTFRCL